MKRWLSLLLALCLPLTALAEVPAHVTEQLYSNSGHSSITIDADVVVPDAEAIPRYQVKMREFTEAEVYAMADALFGGKAYTGDSGYQITNSGRLTWQDMALSTVETVDTGRDYSLWVSNIRDMDGSLYMVQAELSAAQVLGEGYFQPRNRLEGIPEGGPDGCAISREDAQALADAAVASFAPHMTLADTGVMDAELVQEKDPLYLPVDHQGWGFVYTRDLPLPVTYEWQTPNNDFGEIVCREIIVITVDDNGIGSMWYESPFEITQALDENCELLPFDKIMDVARAILPLSVTWLEATYADIRLHIDRIQLGYMVVLSRGNASCCEIIPVWDFFGTEELRRTVNGEITVSNDNPFTSLLTINALDGTIIDRYYGY